jgi:hypothetical protein
MQWKWMEIAAAPAAVRRAPRRTRRRRDTAGDESFPAPPMDREGAVPGAGALPNPDCIVPD